MMNAGWIPVSHMVIKYEGQVFRAHSLFLLMFHSLYIWAGLG